MFFTVLRMAFPVETRVHRGGRISTVFFHQIILVGEEKYKVLRGLFGLAKLAVALAAVINFF